MRKILLFAIMAISFNLTTKSQEVDLRSVVAVIHPNYYESSTKFLNDFSSMLRKDGYVKAADWLESYAKGGFGTGFAYQDTTTKEIFIITNRHVVMLANSATIEFIGSDKSVVKYENCPVVAVDDKIDLALIALPYGVQRPSLTFAKQEIKDGEDVFTASYPALGGKPSWQFGKGVVSNSKFYSTILEEYENIPLIQHTAQIDAGSSGSPLLIKSAESANGYHVVGLSTWKALARENANIAIPAKYIINFINEHNQSKITISNEAQLLEKANEFVKALDDYKKIIPFISYEYLSEITPGDFNDWYRACPKEAKDVIVKHFNKSNPIEGVRTALAYAIYNKMTKKSLKVVDVDNSNVNMLYENKPATSQWVEEQGNLRVKSLSFFNARTSGKNGIATDFGYKSSLAFGISKAPAHKSNLLFNISYCNTTRTFMTYDVTLKFGSIPINQNSYNYSTSTRDTTTVILKTIGIDLSYGGQLPIRLGPICLIPYIKPFVGTNMVEDGFIFNYGVKSGLETAYRINNRNYLILGIGYKFTRLAVAEFFRDTYVKTKFHNFDTFIKITL